MVSSSQSVRVPPQYERPEPMTLHDWYVSQGYEFEEVTYTLPDGGTFSTMRPKGLPHNYPFAGRSVTGEELLAIWAYHSKPLF